MRPNPEYITISQAAEVIGVSERRVHTYIKRAYFQTKKEGMRRLLSRKDVEDYAETRAREKEEAEENSPYPVNGFTIKYLANKIRSLEANQAAIMRILNLHNEPLDLKDHELYSLYRSISERSMSEDWSPHEEMLWTDVFVRIRIDEVERLYRLTDDEHPWRPFYKLCRAMEASPHSEDNQLILREGRQNLERIAAIWATGQGTSAYNLSRIFESEEKPARKLARKVSNKRAKNQE